MTQTDIINFALQQINTVSINDVNDQSDNLAVRCKSTYTFVLNSMIESNEWSFCSTIALLSPLDDSLNNLDALYSNIYQLPYDLIKIQNISIDGKFNDPNLEYKIVQDKIYINSTTVYIQYDTSLVKTSMMTPSFTIALAYGIASSMVTSLVNDIKLQQQLTAMYYSELSRAINNDSAVNGQVNIASSETITIRR